MIRTTVRFGEDLYKEARKKAIDDRVTFADIVNEAVAEYLGRPIKKVAPKNPGLEFLEKLVELGKKHPIKGAPKDLAKNLDKYLWDEYRHS